jgi:hypothetical protein
VFSSVWRGRCWYAPRFGGAPPYLLLVLEEKLTWIETVEVSRNIQATASHVYLGL